ncbi:MAG: hypothetical protein ACD_72C00048G0002 [uncultured bacterium]|nr:MAG: hypothetical protein ACD_72C00048G0002 [uncultured bacterium]
MIFRIREVGFDRSAPKLDFERDESVSKEMKFDAAVDVEIETAMFGIEEKFEKTKNKEDRLPFHNQEHS